MPFISKQSLQNLKDKAEVYDEYKELICKFSSLDTKTSKMYQEISKLQNDLQSTKLEIGYLTQRKNDLLLLLAKQFGLDVKDVPEKTIPAKVIPEHYEIEKVRK